MEKLILTINNLIYYLGMHRTSFSGIWIFFINEPVTLHCVFLLMRLPGGFVSSYFVQFVNFDISSEFNNLLNWNFWFWILFDLTWAMFKLIPVPHLKVHYFSNEGGVIIRIFSQSYYQGRGLQVRRQLHWFPLLWFNLITIKIEFHCAIFIINVETYWKPFKP